MSQVWTDSRENVATLVPVGHVSLSPSFVSGLIALADGLAVGGTGLVIYLLYVGWSGEQWQIYLAALAIHMTMTIAAFHFAKLYDFESVIRPEYQHKRIVLICMCVFVVLMVLAFALKISTQFSRVWAFAWFFSATFLICLERTCSHLILYKFAHTGRLIRNVVIFGGGKQGEKLVKLLHQQGGPWIRIIGIFDDRSSRISAKISGHRVLGNLDALIRYARDNRVDDLLVALPWGADERVLHILKKLSVLPVHVRLSPDMVGLNFLYHSYTNLYGIPVLNIFEKPLAGWNYILKMAEDLVLGVLILGLVAPIMLIIAAFIKLDSPGPVFFRQKRYGLNDQLIEVMKFRTMYDDKQDDSAEKLVTQNDPRVTRVGALLRRTSLDELPQLFNVLKGDMSLVGPRPHATKAKAAGKLYQDVVDEYAVRHKVKPGITGWAQINGWRGETDTEEKIVKRVEHDLYYIKNWSLLLDLRILTQTALIGLVNKNAY